VAYSFTCAEGNLPGVLYGLDRNRNTVKIMISMDEKMILKGCWRDFLSSN